jgi:hypothetical protein
LARYSVSRAVARASASSNTKNYKGERPWGFYSVLIVIAILGTLGIIYSRSEMVARDTAASTSTTVPIADQPTVGMTWRVALGFYVCGKFEPNLSQSPNASTIGINTSGNGIITVAPKTKAETGIHASFGYFIDHYPGLKVNLSELTIPTVGTFKTGSTCPGSSTKASVSIRIFSGVLDKTGQNYSGNINSLKLNNGELITVAFGPSGQKIPQPPSGSQLLQALPPTTTTSAPTGVTPTIPLNNSTAPKATPTT